jgi:hypothetical protein
MARRRRKADAPPVPTGSYLPGPDPEADRAQTHGPAPQPADHPVTLRTLLEQLRFGEVCRVPSLVQALQTTPEGRDCWRQLTLANLAVCVAASVGPDPAHVRRLVTERWGGYDLVALGHACSWLVTERGLTPDQAQAVPLADLPALLRGRLPSSSPERGPQQGHVLTPADVTILAVLARAACALKYSRIVQEAGRLVRSLGGQRAAAAAGLVTLGESTVAQRVAVLEGYGLVTRPPGADGKPSRRKGVGITEQGQLLVPSLPPNLPG